MKLLIGMLGIVVIVAAFWLWSMGRMAARGDEMNRKIQDQLDMEREEDPYYVEIKDDES